MKITIFILAFFFMGCANSPPIYRWVDAVRPMFGTNITIEEIGIYKSDDTTQQIPKEPDSCSSFPTLKNKTLPFYPEIARRAYIEGTVTIKAWFDTSGNSIKAQVQDGQAWSYTPSTAARTKCQDSTANLFINSTMNDLGKCAYYPYRTNCKPSTFISVMRFNYTLQASKQE